MEVMPSYLMVPREELRLHLFESSETFYSFIPKDANIIDKLILISFFEDPHSLQDWFLYALKV
jgi:hypothetical protein